MHTTATRPASSRRNSLARAAVFAEFRPRDARAIDQAGFIDRRPDQAPRLHAEFNAGGEAVLHFAEVLSQVGGEAST